MRSVLAVSWIAILGAAACNPALESSNSSISGDSSRGQPSNKQEPFAYVRLPQSLVTQEFVAATGFNRDHKRDDLYAFGYIAERPEEDSSVEKCHQCRQPTSVQQETAGCCDSATLTHLTRLALAASGQADPGHSKHGERRHRVRFRTRPSHQLWS